VSPRSTGTSPCSSRGRGEPLFRRAFLLALAAVPVAFLPLSRDAWGAPKLALAGAACLLAAAGLAAARGLGRAASRIDLPFAAFALAAALSAAASVDPWLSWLGVDRFYLYAFPGWAAVAAAFYLGCALRNSPGGSETAARDAARALCAGAVLVGAAAVLQWLGWLQLDVWLRADAERPCSTIGNYASLGLYAAMVLPSAFSLGRRAGPDRLLGSAAFLLGSCTLGLSGSRGAFLAAAGGGAVAWWMSRGKSVDGSAGSGGPIGSASVPILSEQERDASGAAEAIGTVEPHRPLPERAAGRGIMPAGILLVVLLAVASLSLRTVWRPLTQDDTRLACWRAAAGIFAEQPWLGSGPGTFGIGFRLRKTEPLAHQLPADAHNDWAEVLATTGAVGIAAYAWLHWSLLSAVLAARREGEGRALAPAGAALAAALVFMKFNSPTVGVAWVAAALAGVLLGSLPGKRARFRAGPVLLPACAAALCVFSARALAGDLQNLLGRKSRWEGRMAESEAHFRKAVGLRPEVTAYRYDLSNLLWHASERVESPEGSRVLLAQAVDVALAGIARRPLDSDLYRLLGIAELRRAEAGEGGRLTAARAALESSRRLDPFFEPTLKDLAEVAGLQGDPRARREFEAVLSRARMRAAGGL